jgi:hypothetical protein
MQNQANKISGGKCQFASLELVLPVAVDSCLGVEAGIEQNLFEEGVYVERQHSFAADGTEK